MLDTYGRKFVQPAFNKLGKVLIHWKLKPIQITIIALLIGLMTSGFIWFDMPIIAVSLLWISGIFDVLDGTVARLSHQKSDLGAFLDITFDRLVEIALIVILAFKYADARMSLVILSVSIVLSMTIFLTVASFNKNTGEKSFYYQAGVAERTEGFIFFTLLILIPKHITWITLLFAGVILFTSGQRFIEGLKLLKRRI